jgi:hypothetical protein
MHPQGIETRFLAVLPEALLAGIVPLACIAIATEAGMVRILALAFMVGWGLALVPAALLCLIVYAMKGRPRTADSYPLPDQS